MRGKVYLVLYLVFGDRITPAHAGKSNLPSDLFDSYGDHPRTCGEKNFVNFAKGAGAGSPPHMRGKVAVLAFGGLCAGITPAHAGKRTVNSDHPRTCGDHPRTCGDHPRTCGEKFMSQYKLYLSERITPAHAGKRKLSRL